MKLLLIAPKSAIPGVGTEGRFIKIPSLTLPTLAALTPEDVEISIVNEAVEDLPRSTDADLIGITSMTSTAPRAYQLADTYRAEGRTVILGGIHASVLPEEAACHADAVIQGEAEGVWPRAVRDFQAGSIQRFYKNETYPDLRGLPHARRDLLSMDRYLPFHVFQASRGCPYDCRFCSVTRLYGHRYRLRPVDEVLGEIDDTLRREPPLTRRRKYGFYGQKYALYFTDDNIAGRMSYAADLFRGLKAFGRYFTVTASLDLAENEDLVALAAEAGCLWVGVGFESLSQETLKTMAKLPNHADRFRDAIDTFHRHGICVVGSFVVGNDEDTTAVFPALDRFTRTTGLDMMFPLISTPLPGSRLAEELEAEGRILSRNWSLYDCIHVVFQPKQMTPRHLARGHRWLWKRLYSFDSIAERLRRSPAHRPFNTVMNLGMRFLSRGVFAKQVH